MVQALALAINSPVPVASELLRRIVVCSCAMALIGAGQALPALGL